MINRRDFLKTLFKKVATPSIALALAGTLMAGISTVNAEEDEEFTQNFSEVYKHKTLASNSTEPVGVQLVLALDTSGSMTTEEFAIELKATAHGVNSELFRNVIKYKSGNKSVAISVIDFDDDAFVRIGWVDIRGHEINDKPYHPGEEITSKAPDKLDMLAREIENLSRRSWGGTEIHKALELSQKMFIASPWQTMERRVVDVFGDGSDSYILVADRRDRLAEMGVTVNGFAIANEDQSLPQWYGDYVRTVTETKGPDGLYSQPGQVWVVARDMQQFNNSSSTLKSFFGEVARGMRQKISVEVGGLDNYYRTLARLNRMPDFPLPANN